MLFASASAQDNTPVDAIRIASPLPGHSVDDGALFVVLDVDPSFPVDPETIELTLDGNVVDMEPKVSSASIRYLIRDRLSGGRHVIAFSARTIDGLVVDPVTWHFFVAGSERNTQRSGPSRSIRGTTYAGTRNADISGNSALRQEPTATYVARTDITARYGAFTFPIKAYLTTDESSTAQPRNRVLVGAESRWLSLYGGDTQPEFGPLALTGARTRGVLAELRAPGVSLSVTHGRLRRAVDLLSLSDGGQVASPFLNTFERNMTAVRLAFGSARTVEFNLHALKARDDTTSLAFGTRPMENVVAGSDFTVRALQDRLAFDAGAALSLTTEDIARGVSDKAELDSLFETDLPIDPADFSWLITLNPSTVPLRIDKLSSLSWYAKARGRAFGHQVTTEYRSIGSAFYSAGNPFLVNDRRSFSITDRFRTLQDRLSGTLRFLRYGTQPDNSGLTIPLESRLYSANLTFRPNPDLPTVTTGLRINTRTRGDEISTLSDSRIVSASLGLLQQFSGSVMRHTVQVLAARTRRTDRINPALDNTTSTLTLGLYEQLSARLSANVQVTLVRIGYDTASDSQRWTSASGGLSRKWSSVPLRVSVDGRFARAGASTLLTGSNRYGGSVTGAYDIQRNMTLELQVGVDTFRDDVIEEARYTERFVSIRHRYTF